MAFSYSSNDGAICSILAAIGYHGLLYAARMMVAEFGKTFWKLPGLKNEILSVGTHRCMAASRVR
jgi:hypothetical protein